MPRKSRGVSLAGRRGNGFIGDIGSMLLDTGKNMATSYVKNNGASIAGNLAKVGAQALINKTLGSGYKVSSIKVVKRRR